MNGWKRRPKRKLWNILKWLLNNESMMYQYKAVFCGKFIALNAY